MSDVRARLAFRRSIRQYLNELSVLSGASVSEADLMPLERMEPISEAARELDKKPTRRLEMPFEAKRGARFAGFIDALYRLNPGPVYIWTERTNVCGLFRVESVKAVDFSFDYLVNPEGIVVLLAADLCDKMILDFSEDQSGQKVLEIELFGEHWPSAIW